MPIARHDYIITLKSLMQASPSRAHKHTARMPRRRSPDPRHPRTRTPRDQVIMHRRARCCGRLIRNVRNGTCAARRSPLAASLLLIPPIAQVLADAWVLRADSLTVSVSVSVSSRCRVVHACMDVRSCQLQQQLNNTRFFEKYYQKYIVDCSFTCHRRLHPRTRTRCGWHRSLPPRASR